MTNLLWDYELEVEEFDDTDHYSKQALDAMRSDDEISVAEEAFMRGLLYEEDDQES